MGNGEAWPSWWNIKVRALVTGGVTGVAPVATILTTVHVYADETKAQGLLIAAAFVSPADTQQCRRTLRDLGCPHFAKESEQRRKRACSEIVKMPVEVRVYDASSMKNDKAARTSALWAMVEDFGPQGVRHLVLDQDDSTIDSDRRTLYRAVRKHQLVDQLEYRHMKYRSEPLLCIPDAVAWCINRGPQWRQRVAPLIVATIKV